MLARAASALRDANTYTFEMEATRVRADRPDDAQRVFEGSGAADIRARTGRMELDMSGLLAGLPQGETNPLGEPIRLRWDATTFAGETAAGEGTASRARARASDGLIGRIPDEVDGLVRLLELGTDARRGDEAADVAFAVPVEQAAAAGTPAELYPAAARRLLRPRIQMVATVDGSGRPTRISYTYRLKPTHHPDTGRVVLPSRSVTVVYRLADFGEDVGVGAVRMP